MGCSAGSWPKLDATNAKSRIAGLISFPHKRLDSFSVHFGDIEHALRVDRHEVGQLQDVGSAPTTYHLTILIEMKDLVDLAFGNQQLLARDQQSVGIPEPRPDRQATPFRVENLHAIVSAVGYINMIARIDGQAVGHLKLTWLAAFASPL